MMLRQADASTAVAIPGSAGVVVLILAKDEASVVADTVRSAIGQVGVRGEVHVVADGCRDATARVARAAGARVFERPARGPQGKGAALNWWLRHTHAGAGPDQAIVLLDADSQMEPGCIPSLVEALGGGADAVQAQIVPHLASDSPLALLAALSEIAEQRLGDALRTRLGWPVRLRGTGMALQRSLLETLAPSLRTVVEDAELTLLLAGAGRASRWIAGARLRDPKPATARFAAQQRARWLRGQVDLLRAQPGAVAATMRRGLPGWSILSSILLKPRAFVLPVAAALALGLWSLTSGLPWLAAAALPLTMWLAWNLVTMLVASAWTAHPHRTLRALLAAPLYLLLWLASARLALQSGEPWLRARPVDVPTRPAGEPGHAL